MRIDEETFKSKVAKECDKIEAENAESDLADRLALMTEEELDAVNLGSPVDFTFHPWKDAVRQETDGNPR